MIRDQKTSKGDNMDIDHIKPLVKGGSNDPSNLRIIDKHVNRSFPRDRRARMK